jgi:hypothetical protein
MTDAILMFIGKVVAYGGGGAAVAFGLFRFFGKKWIENKFAQNLEKYKNEQRKELEDFRLKINTLFNRITKIHEKEIEILPLCWSKLHDAKNLISYLVSPLQSYPDFSQLNENEIRVTLKDSPFDKFQIEELIQERDRNKYYQERIFWHRLHDAKKKFSDLHDYITKNRIFLSEDLKYLFTEASDLLWDALISKEIGQEAKDYKMVHEAYKKLRDNIEEIMEKIEKQVQDRLHYDKA